MNAPVAVRTLRDHRRGLGWWALGLIAFVVVHLLVYPTARDQGEQFDRLVESYPEPVRAIFGLDDVNYGSPTGYLDAELFSFMLPLLLLMFAISQGSRATAGPEEDQRLDLLLAQPVPRGRFLLHRHLAGLVMAAGLCGVVFVTLRAGTVAQGMDVGASGLAAALAGVLLLAAVYGGLALLVGALTGRRSLAAAVTAVAAVAAFLVHTLARLASWLEPLRPLSPFHWYDRGDALRSGLDPLGTAVLLVAAAALAAGALAAFDRRDLAT